MTHLGWDDACRFADRVAAAYFDGQPVHATIWNVPGYDDRLPDLSPEGRARWREQLLALHLEGEGLTADGDAAVVLSAARDRLAVELGQLDAVVDDVLPQALPLVDGLGQLELVLRRAVVDDRASADSYLARCRSLPAYLDQLGERFRRATAEGRTPVRSLVEAAIAQADAMAADPHALVHTSTAGAGVPGLDGWRTELAAVARDALRPAVSRYAETLRALLPHGRPQERAGMVHVPGGLAGYAMRVRWGTTLALDPDDVHRIGLEELARVEDRLAELGSRAFGVGTLEQVLDRLRQVPPYPTEELVARATQAVRRAEELALPVLPEPVAPPCAVEEMPEALAALGAPPMYVPPTRQQPGAYLFNTRNPGPAASFALEVATFHETVPGHHTQHGRQQQLGDLPVLLSAFLVIPYAEGWGLYVEQLADELGLYSDEVQRLGMLATHAWRAVRLVVDTGIHARGWSQERALRFALEHTPMPEAFMAMEVGRYVAVPGQALGYLIGQRELLALREQAKARDGAAFDLRAFHAAVLGHGSLPLPALRLAVEQDLALA